MVCYAIEALVRAGVDELMVVTGMAGGPPACGFRAAVPEHPRLIALAAKPAVVG